MKKKPGSEVGGGLFLEEICPVRPVAIELCPGRASGQEQKEQNETHAAANLVSLHPAADILRFFQPLYP